MKVRFFSFEMFHGKKGVGSTRLQVHNPIKYWPEAALYKYGENPDVLIFQKVYITADYKFPAHFEGLKILYICDPDWLDKFSVKETVDAMDGVIVPTEPLADFIRQLTDKPIKVIPDRHDLADVPKLINHVRVKPRLVWFGYAHNSEVLRFAIPTVESLDLELTVISEQDPQVERFANDEDGFRAKVRFVKFDDKTLIDELRRHDIFLNPPGNRPKDRFKSNNRTVIAWLAGLPMATTGDELRELRDPAKRNIIAKKNYNKAIKEYDVKQSVIEMQEFIEELKNVKKTN